MVPTRSDSAAPRNVTNPPSGAARPLNGTDGEQTPGVGSQYSAVLVQRENKSLPGEQPSVGGGAPVGTIPVVSANVRRTGRL